MSSTDSTDPDSTDPKPGHELAGLDPQELLMAGLESAPPVTSPASPADPDATVPVARQRPTPPASPQVELPLPEELTELLPLGAYCVERFLGQGGMGAVYKGLQVRLKRPVAIKIMSREQGKDLDFEQRFEREAQAMARLNHPNIVSVIDYGEAGPHYLYIVMEFVDGADLMDVIRTGRMTQEMALLLLPQICDALQFAHDHGIVHRDIKPSNIMLTRDGGIKMADFGLAKHFDVESSFHTQTGTGMGSPDYAAPEQFDPHSRIDHRADIYALGVMIYQMITGTLPRGTWKPPSQRAQVSAQWDAVVGRSMQNDPADRYQHASEVKTELSSIALPVAAAGSTSAKSPHMASGEPSAPPKPKSRALFLFGLITAIVILATSAFLLLKPSPAPPAEAEGPGVRQPSAALAEAPDTKPASPVVSATQAAPFTNTLGMKFVPVPITGGPTDGQRVLFSVWETRVRDYEAFAQAEHAVGRKVDGEWKSQSKDGVPVGREPEHPVVGMNWGDAQRFCAWLTAKEQAEGRLPKELRYRLPSDHEWSCAVGIGGREDAGKTPEEKHQKIDEYPWGGGYPPPGKAGNYADESFHGKFPFNENAKESWNINRWIEGCEDGFATTSPAGSFAANELGLHDLEGNVREWVEDWWNKEQKDRVLRGASWADGTRSGLRSSSRIHGAPTGRNVSLGLRVVLAVARPSEVKCNNQQP